MSKHNRDRRKKRRDDPLTGLATETGITVFVGEEALPLLAPLKRWPDHVEFDRRVCERGVKEFVRESMVSDFPASMRAETMESCCLVRVVEVRPGVRVRHAMEAGRRDPM